MQNLYLALFLIVLVSCGKPDTFYYQSQFCNIDLDGNSHCFNADGSPK